VKKILNFKNKTAELVIENSEFLRDFWVSSEKIGVHFSDNFIDFLPGKHIIKVSYSDNNFSLSQLNYFWR
jgi:frataxin-like iron-binding protein CyaY